MSVQFSGTSLNQDSKFGDKMKRLKKQLDFSRVLKRKIDFSKVRLNVLKPWIAERVVHHAGFEDDILVDYVFTMLEDNPDPKDMQIHLTGFMGTGARAFMKELWLTLDESQKEASGIPKRFLEKEKEIMRQEEELRDEISKRISEKRLETNNERRREPNNERRREPNNYRQRNEKRKRDHREYDNVEENKIRKKRKI